MFSHYITFPFAVFRFVPFFMSSTAHNPAIPSGPTPPLTSIVLTLVSPLFPYIPSIHSPAASSPLVASALARINCYAHSRCYVRHKRIHFSTTVHVSKSSHCNMEYQSLSCGTVGSVDAILTRLMQFDRGARYPSRTSFSPRLSLHSLACRGPEHTAKVRRATGKITSRLLAATHT